MDLLQRELQRKKQALAKAKAEEKEQKEQDDNKNKKGKKHRFLRQSDIRRIEEEQEEIERQRIIEEQRQARKLRQQQQQRKRNNENDDTDDVKNNSRDKKKHKKMKKEKKKKNKNRQNNNNDDTTNTQSERNQETSKDNDGNNTQNNNDDDDDDDTKTTAQHVSSGTAGMVVLSDIELTVQLRTFGLPVKYFGETYQQRKHRLEEALEKQNQTLQGLSEKEEFRLGKGHGIRNTFLERRQSSSTIITNSNNTDNNNANGNDQKSNNINTSAASSSNTDTDISNKNVTKNDQNAGSKKANKKNIDTNDEDNNNDDDGNDNINNDDMDDDDEHQDDPPKRIYKYLKGLLKDWEYELSQRSESIARSVTGKNESKTYKQCKDYIRPLFKLLKSRKLEAGLQAHLLKIVNFAQDGEFVHAHDAYLDVAIGRAAWPIGVTMVGIHARTGRAKIESANVAHVMNSELQRKYLTSVKRLLSFAQKQRTDVDPSKKVS